MRLPNPASLVNSTGLSPESYLQQVLVSELKRVKTLSLTPPLPKSSALTLGSFEASLRKVKGRAIIAEYKQASPSLGNFAEHVPLLPQLTAYVEGGAAALSILTEPSFFLGSIHNLWEASRLDIPLLYKGFIISESQLAEAERGGAHAVLLIARVLGEHTASFAQAARARGLEPLIELHDLTEAHFAQNADATLIGINARDLSTFKVDEPNAESLRRFFPDALLIRESGLATPEDAQHALQSGFDAVLIGEALMRSRSPVEFLKQIQPNSSLRGI